MTAPQHSRAASFSFWLQSIMTFGPAAVRSVPGWLRERGYRRSVAIVDAAVLPYPLVAEVSDVLRGDLARFETYPNAVSEPDYDYLDEVAVW